MVVAAAAYISISDSWGLSKDGARKEGITRDSSVWPGDPNFYFVLILSQLAKLLWICAFQRHPGLQKLHNPFVSVESSNSEWCLIILVQIIGVDIFPAK